MCDNAAEPSPVRPIHKNPHSRQAPPQISVGPTSHALVGVTELTPSPSPRTVDSALPQPKNDVLKSDQGGARLPILQLSGVLSRLMRSMNGGA